MKLQSFLISLALLIALKSPVLALASSSFDPFFQCLSLHLNDSKLVSRVIHTQNSSSFSEILHSSVQNPIFSSPETPKPISIVTPLEASHVQATIRCARRYSVHIRTRSGGHDYEGLSYVAPTEFIVIDLANLRSISIDSHTQTAWVQAGATAGELYHEIAKKSKTLAFPAGLFSTVGVGGQFSGGGFGTLLRKYGLAADNIVDAQVVDSRGRFLDRQGMGEEFFWAIRGGGGSSFGVVLSWKIQLVDVPLTLTVFNVTTTTEQEAVKIIQRWQNIADKVTDDLFIRVMLQKSDKARVRASFPGLYLGPVDKLLPIMDKEFPELGLAREDCKEMSWIESVVWFAEYPEGTSIDVLAKRKRSSKSFKGKSDFVEEPVPEHAIRELWRRLHAPEAEMAKLILTPFGGKMSQIAENGGGFGIEETRDGNDGDEEHEDDSGEGGD
ncbi:PREDICTED: berberine bridge enzyme-like 6 [Tarenaya hassleriana]|uniref:berberine bridge enzyme-like 6 n=1 Tax=Tarenaya hassleriana TaxID=28532 RepID=UPI00053C1CAF|nr:PREDICTED: berberine bridge enzyme-like 6 [Tarenaya hassleriana]XP_010537263.1 PREDICTED: berberine bridge enzyme-like 6 [Tarenaya hassleriana]